MPPPGPARNQAGCATRVERTLTKTWRSSACTMLPSPSQLMSRSRMRLVRSASRGPTTTRREPAAGRTPGPTPGGGGAGVEPHHVKRRAGGDAEPAALADGEMDDAVVMAEHAAVEMDDVPGAGGPRPQTLDHFGVMPGRHEANILAVLLVGDRQTEMPRQFARLRLGAVAERKAKQIELRPRRAEQKITLIALGLTRAIKRAAAARQRAGGHVMAGGQHLGAELARGLEQVAEFDRLIALHALHRRLAGHIARGETVDHRFLEAAFVIEHVMRNAEAGGYGTGIMDVAAGAAGALAVGRCALIVELERDADHVIAGLRQQRRRDRGIDAARHGDDNARVG